MPFQDRHRQPFADRRQHEYPGPFEERLEARSSIRPGIETRSARPRSLTCARALATLPSPAMVATQSERSAGVPRAEIKPAVFLLAPERPRQVTCTLRRAYPGRMLQAVAAGSAGT